MNPELLHPLAKVEVITTDNGHIPVMNSWALASFIWLAIQQNNPEALKMALELFPDPNQIDLLQAQNDEAAFRQASAIMATALEEKVNEAFLDDR